MKRSLFALGLLLTFGGCVLQSRPVAAQVAAAPSLLNFQGRLARPDNTPISDGTYALRFSLHTAETGGTELWNQTLPMIAVKNGVFAALLNVGSGFQNGATTSTLFSNNLFLEIKVGTDAPLTPRQPLVSVAYAMKANTVPDGSITPEKLASGALNNLSWLLSGNNITNPTTQFLGSTSNQPLVFRTNNVERMRLAQGGNLGIGTTNPQNNRVQINNVFHSSSGYGLTVANANFGANVQYNGSGIGLVVDKSDAANGSTVFLARARVATSPQNLFTVLDNGNVGIGTSTPTDRFSVTNSGINLFVVNTNGTAQVSGGLGVNNGSDITLQASSATPGDPGDLIFRTGGGSERGRIFVDPNAQWLQLRTSPASYPGLTVNELNNVGIGYNGYSNRRLAVNGDLTVDGTGFANGGFWLASDARYKTEVQTLSDAMAHILALRGVIYDWKRDAFPEKHFPQGHQIGFIAQEVEKVLPQLVYTDSNGYKAVNYTNVVPVLVEAMKTQQKQMEAERARRNAEISELKAQMNALMQRLAELENHQARK